MEINFGYDEMKNFIMKGGKYKIANIKCFNQVPGNWYNGFRYTEEEVYTTPIEKATSLLTILEKKELWHGSWVLIGTCEKQVAKENSTKVRQFFGSSIIAFFIRFLMILMKKYSYD